MAKSIHEGSTEGPHGRLGGRLLVCYRLDSVAWSVLNTVLGDDIAFRSNQPPNTIFTASFDPDSAGSYKAPHPPVPQSCRPSMALTVSAPTSVSQVQGVLCPLRRFASGRLTDFPSAFRHSRIPLIGEGRLIPAGINSYLQGTGLLSTI